MTFRSPDSKANGKAILIADGEEPDYSILKLEGVVGDLLKEQQDLKNKLLEQEQRLHTLSHKSPEGVKSPLKLKKRALQASRANIFNNKEKLNKRMNPHQTKSTPVLKKSKSTARSNNVFGKDDEEL